MIYSYCDLEFKKDSVIVCQYEESSCLSKEGEVINKSLPEIRKFAYRLKKSSVIIKNFEFEALHVKRNTLIVEKGNNNSTKEIVFEPLQK